MVRPFSRQKRPRPALAPSDVRASVLPLAVTIVIVTMPNRADRSVHLQYRINYLQRIHDQRIVGSSNPVAHELKEAGVDDAFCEE